MRQFGAPPPLDSLLDLACRDGVDIRPTLLRVLTDLYVQKPTHTVEEETQYVELVLGLIDNVDAPTRAAVEARLSAYPAAPVAVLRRLKGLPVSPPSEPAPVKPATPPQEDLAALFFMAGTDERRLILTNLDVGFPPAPPVTPASPELILQLEAAALSRNAPECARLIERALGISDEIAARIVRDHSGEPIVVIAKALGMRASVLQRILLFLNPVIGQSVERVYDLARLYDEMTPNAAARMVAIWRGGSRPRPAHAPVHWDDERRNARAAVTPGEYRAPQRRFDEVERNRSNKR